MLRDQNGNIVKLVFNDDGQVERDENGYLKFESVVSDEILNELVNSNPKDAADRLSNMSVREGAWILSADAIDYEVAVDVLSEMNPEEAAEVLNDLAELNPEKAAQTLNAFADPDEDEGINKAANILFHMNGARAATILSADAMDHQVAADVLKVYPYKAAVIITAMDYQDAVDILSEMDPYDRDLILSALEELNPDKATQIKNELFPI